MANTPINQFSEDGMRRIAAAVRRVEQTPTMRQTLSVPRPSPQAREIRWARTTTSYDYPTYPTSGPAYVVEFGDYATSPDPPYPGATITKTFTPYDPEWKEVAVDPAGGTWAQSTVVRVERNGGQWWIRPEASTQPNACWGCWSLGGTGKVFQDGSSTAETSPYPIYTAGMWLHFGGVRSVARVSNELGTCFVVPTSGLDDIEPAVDIQQYGYYEVTIYTSWYLPPLSLSNARSVLRAAGHDHSYTDNGTPMTTGTATPDVLGLDSYNVAAVQTELHLSGGGSTIMGSSTLPLYYSAETEPYRYANHSATVVVSQLAATLQGLRIKVLKTDSTLYSAPRLGSCHLFIRQLYPFGTDPI